MNRIQIIAKNVICGAKFGWLWTFDRPWSSWILRKKNKNPILRFLKFFWKKPPGNVPRLTFAKFRSSRCSQKKSQARTDRRTDKRTTPHHPIVKDFFETFTKILIFIEDTGLFQMYNIHYETTLVLLENQYFEWLKKLSKMFLLVNVFFSPILGFFISYIWLIYKNCDRTINTSLNNKA